MSFGLVWFSLFVCGLVAPAWGATIPPDVGPRVAVNEGILVGVTVPFTEDRFINASDNVDLFLGVPFADPPSRFAPPDSKTPWDGEYDATEMKPACLQKPSPLYPDQSEDCLYLNIVAPSPKPTGAAVMVWIHGGSFSVGTAMSQAYYNPAMVVVGDVIIVTINYRLGILAQFTTKDEEAPGNIGLLDQVAALRWVHANIEAFGGDPNRITLFGESSGSASVGFHLLSKLSQGYFSQAIMQSGSPLSPWAFRDKSEYDVWIAGSLGAAMGCGEVSTSAALVTCLREKDGAEIILAGDKISGGLYPVIIDGTFLEASPTALYADGVGNNATNIMAGFTRDEGTFYVQYGVIPPPPISADTFRTLVGGILQTRNISSDLARDVILQEYIDWTIADDPEADYWRSSIDIITDGEFGCPTDSVLRHHVAAGAKAYEYYMTHVPSTSIYGISGTESPEWMGATHAEDVPLVFAWGFNDILKTYTGFTMTDEEMELSVSIIKFWTNFANSGDPSKSSNDAAPGTGQDAWPEFTVPGLGYKELSTELREGRGLRARQCSFWREHFPRVAAYAASQNPTVNDAPAVDAGDTGAPDADAAGDACSPRGEWREAYEEWKAELRAWREEFSSYRETVRQGDRGTATARGDRDSGQGRRQF